MKKDYDVLVVGAGLAGSTISRYLADNGISSLIIETKDKVAGHIYDEVDEHGILIQKYGPHIFHTDKSHVWDWVEKFSNWVDFQHEPLVHFDGVTTEQPFNFQSIDDFLPEDEATVLKEKFTETYPEQESVTIPEILNSDVPEIQKWAQFLWDNDYKLYTSKQWGRKPEDIDPSVLKRVPFRLGYGKSYFPLHERVALPESGYTKFVKSMLDHELIEVVTSVSEDLFSIDAEGRTCLDGKTLDKPVVYTGAIDQLFKNEMGILPYRSLKFEWIHDDSTDSYLPAPVVAYPKEETYTRITEYNKLPIQKTSGTTYAREFPEEYVPGENDPYYPVRTPESEELYEKYLERVSGISNLYLAGRLADYRYYDMAPTIDTSLEKAKRIVEDYSSERGLEK